MLQICEHNFPSGEGIWEILTQISLQESAIAVAHKAFDTELAE